MKLSLALAVILPLAACGSGSGGTTNTGTTGTGTGSSGATTSGGSGASGATGSGTSGAINSIGLWIDGAQAISATALAAAVGTPTAPATPAFSDTCPLPSSQSSSSIGPAAFDGEGNLWIESTGDDSSVFDVWSAAQLATACSSGTPSRMINFNSGLYLQSIAFDSKGNLWGTDTEDSEIVGYKAADLNDAGVKVSWAIQGQNGGVTNALYTPVGLAFDSSGDLWIGNFYSVIAFKPATLAAATGTLDNAADSDGDLQITNLAAAENVGDAGGSTVGYGGYQYQWPAFDSAGNLWITVENNQSGTLIAQIDEFTKAQLAALGTNDMPTPALVIADSTAQQAAGFLGYSQIAFDAAGHLWAGCALAQPNLFRFTPSGASAGTPDITISLTTDTSNLAFNPIPSGLPIQP